MAEERYTIILVTFLKYFWHAQFIDLSIQREPGTSTGHDGSIRRKNTIVCTAVYTITRDRDSPTVPLMKAFPGDHETVSFPWTSGILSNLEKTGAFLMMPLILIAIVVIVFALVIALLFFFSAAGSKNAGAPGTRKNPAPGQIPPSPAPSTQSWLLDSVRLGNVTDGRTTPAPGSMRVTEASQARFPFQNYVPGSPGPAPSLRPQPERNPLPSLPPLAPVKPAHAQSRFELEQEYERGMMTIYDETVGAVNFIGQHVVMNTPAEVDLAFHVCKRQIRAVLRSRGLERAPTLTDIGGIVIGRDATAAWGQALKQYLEEMCIKVGQDTYLLAHYNSQANRPDQDQLQAKLQRIQFMTSAALNHFQSNIFDTREEAVAFLQRMREVYRV